MRTVVGATIGLILAVAAGPGALAATNEPPPYAEGRPALVQSEEPVTGASVHDAMAFARESPGKFGGA